MPFSFKTSLVKINVRFFNLIYPNCLFVISLQKGVFKGAHNNDFVTQSARQGRKAVKL